jgi:ribosomal protein S18 acetylase RimI-like enzyme
MLATRQAWETDLDAVVALLADDEFGRARNPPFADAEADYRAAFAALEGPDNFVVVAARAGNVKSYQLTFLRGLSFRGGLRAQVESVRIAQALRGQGFGSALMRDAIARARTRGAFLVQLTTDERRQEAREFYERLGFAASHHGMKLKLS